MSFRKETFGASTVGTKPPGLAIDLLTSVGTAAMFAGSEYLIGGKTSFDNNLMKRTAVSGASDAISQVAMKYVVPKIDPKASGSAMTQNVLPPLMSGMMYIMISQAMKDDNRNLLTKFLTQAAASAISNNFIGNF